MIVAGAECLLQLCLAVVHPMCELRRNEIWHDGDVFGDALENAQLTPPYQPRRSSTGTGRYQQSSCSDARCVYGTRHRFSKTHDWWKMPQVVHQCTTCLRESAACCVCGTRFTHGEARLQQRGNRETNHHYVRAHCVNGGLGHDHELHPKLLVDQEAVDAVTRQGIPSPGQRQIQKCFPMRRTRIKPQQLLH